jgi:hypothetical protein
MLEPTPFDKAATCRRRAKQARRKAATVEDELAREALLKVAETWDHMAAFEETLGPWRPRDPQ